MPVKKRKKVSGVKAKAVGAVKRKRKSPARRIGKAVARVGSVSTKAKAASKPMDAVSRAVKIGTKINSLEAKYKRTKDKDIKQVIALAINKEHDNLDNIKRSLRR